VHCPHCGAGSTRVLESRQAEDGAAVRRRRECSACEQRFTTYERYEPALFVRKRDGGREPFDRAKLRGGLARAAHKRPVADAAIEAIVERIEAELERAGGELPTSEIGELCLNRLRELDRGAYLQFAGTLPSPDELAVEENSVFAGSSPGGSVRSKSNPAQFPPKRG
jgi:transcriptional repressor NrdR